MCFLLPEAHLSILFTHSSSGFLFDKQNFFSLIYTRFTFPNSKEICFQIPSGQLFSQTECSGHLNMHESTYCELKIAISSGHFLTVPKVSQSLSLSDTQTHRHTHTHVRICSRANKDRGQRANFFLFSILQKLSTPIQWEKKVWGQILIFFIIYIFIYFGPAGSLSLHGCFSSCGECGLFPSCGVDWSLQRPLWLQSMGTCVSVVAAFGLPVGGSQALEHRLSSCETWVSCSVACGVVPDQGSSSVSYTGRQILYHWATRQALYWPLKKKWNCFHL